jgi:holo-[acyl-carrier protein] synthase
LICGIGIDVIEVSRVRAVVERHGERFLRRMYTPLEIERIHGNRDQYLASRFAAKEAALKALGTGWGRGIRWIDVEVDNMPSGRPILTLRGRAGERADSLGVENLHLSITHTADHAAAQVVLEGSGAAARGTSRTAAGSRDEDGGW